MKKYLEALRSQVVTGLILLVVTVSTSVVEAAAVDRSDMDDNGAVDIYDLQIFADLYLEQDWQSVDWCAFHDTSISNPKFFREITSDKVEHYQQLMDFIALSYNCDGTAPEDDQSDLNDDGVVDLADLSEFSEIYLDSFWQSVDWCVFYESTIAEEDFDGKPTRYYLLHFQSLLVFINDHFGCNQPEPPPSKTLLENTPRFLVRIATGPFATSDVYITDPIVGSVFIYDADLVLKAEIKALNRPQGVAIDLQGRLLVGNDGRDNVEVYDPATGDLLAVIGEGQIKMPTAITVDDLGNIYVVDAENHTVRVFDPSYVQVRTIGRGGQGNGGLKHPADVEILNMQEVLVADQGHDRIQVYDLGGTWLRSITFGGSEGQGCNWFTGVCEIPGALEFSRVMALDLDSLGRLHVLDSLGGAVVVLDPTDGAFIGAYGEYGTEAPFLPVPMDVSVSDAGEAIVTSGDGGRIESFDIP